MGADLDLITFVTDRPGHDERYAIDSSKLQRELGWEPSLQFEEGIEKTVRWYLDNQDATKYYSEVEKSMYDFSSNCRAKRYRNIRTNSTTLHKAAQLPAQHPPHNPFKRRVPILV